MGDRASISFKDEYEESVVLFSHWGGRSFQEEAQRFVDQLRKERKDVRTRPLDRLEARTVMVDFIRYLTKNMERVESNYYLGKTENDGDNSDNGHVVISCVK